MKITIIRKYKQANYTIGEMYLNDSQMLCNTLEPTDRGLVNNALPGKTSSEEWLDCAVKARRAKVIYGHGKVAVPTGSYKLKMAVSSHFGARRAFLKDVPGFIGVMIHEGNSTKDTQGCILVGKNDRKGWVSNSRYYLGILNEAILKALERNEEIVLCIR